MKTWYSMDEGGGGAGGQVWVAYRNPHHPNGWNLRVQWTPIQQELDVAPEYWCPVERPAYPSESPLPAAVTVTEPITVGALMQQLRPQHIDAERLITRSRSRHADTTNGANTKGKETKAQSGRSRAHHPSPSQATSARRDHRRSVGIGLDESHRRRRN